MQEILQKQGMIGGKQMRFRCRKTPINLLSIQVFGAGGAPQLQSKTVTPSTSQQTVGPDNGYDGLSSVQVNAISPTKGAETFTPKTYNQTISSGRWLTGTQTIKGDANLVASNIKSGVSIFGVSGTYVGSGSYKIYSGTVEGSYTNFTAVANLDLPTGSDYLDTDKIVWVLIWNETVLEINEAPIVFWEYQRGYTGGGNRQEIGYMTTGDSHVGYGSQNWTVEAHNGYVTAGWRNTDWNRFDGAATYQYLIVSEI